MAISKEDIRAYLERLIRRLLKKKLVRDVRDVEILIDVDPETMLRIKD